MGPGPLFRRFRRTVLSSKEVARRGVEDTIDEGMTQDDIRRNFSVLVTGAQLRAYEIFLESQRDSWGQTIEDFLTRDLGDYVTRNEVIDYLTDNFDEFDSFFLSLTNSRRPRAGYAFQYTMRELFHRLDYPFEEQTQINGKPDFLFPNAAHFERNPMDCIIFTIKRSLRERWRQITTEGTRGLGFFLGTIDDSLSSSIFNYMRENRINVVVPLELKETIQDYREAENVISYEDFLEDYLDPAVNRWRRRSII